MVAFVDSLPSVAKIPPDLTERGYALRMEEESDVPFLRALYASSRERELAVVEGQWSAEQKQAFCDQQFAMQRHHYRTQIADCRFMVIERDGVPIGRLYLQERETRFQLVDITLMSQERNRGFGGRLLVVLIDRAHARGKGVGLFVESYNPALALYRRLGFVQQRETPMYLELECLPDSAPIN